MERYRCTGQEEKFSELLVYCRGGVLMYVKLDDNGRITATTEYKEYAEGMIEFDLPEDFNYSHQGNYRIVDGELIEDPMPMSEEEKKVNEKIERQKQLQTATIMFVNESAPNLTDEQALSVSLLFEEWVVGKEYIKDYIVRYNNELYRIGQTHTSQVQWKPGDEGTIALYSHITITEEGYEVWKAWDGVSGMYAEGQIVEDPNDGQLYKSKIPNNVWGHQVSSLHTGNFIRRKH